MTYYFALLLALSVVCLGCDRAASPVRRYQEIAAAPAAPSLVPPVPAPMAAAAGDMSSMPVETAQAALTWTTPDGWAEEGSSAMRVMTFRVGDSGAECAITVFPGDVGGLEANVQRWAGQLQIALDAAALAEFARAPLALTSAGGLRCQIYDFAALIPETKPDSLLAAVVPLENRTVFVKFTGAASLLAAEKENFLALCRSFRP